jgi:hypothetical protein
MARCASKQPPVVDARFCSGALNDEGEATSSSYALQKITNRKASNVCDRRASHFRIERFSRRLFTGTLVP